MMYRKIKFTLHKNTDIEFKINDVIFLIDGFNVEKFIKSNIDDDIYRILKDVYSTRLLKIIDIQIKRQETCRDRYKILFLCERLNDGKRLLIPENFICNLSDFRHKLMIECNKIIKTFELCTNEFDRIMIDLSKESINKELIVDI